MKEERMRILEMVSEGKIKPEDAVMLIEAVSGSAKKDEYNKVREKAQDLQQNIEDVIKNIAKNLEGMGKDLGKKLDEVGRDIEPRFRKAAQAVVSKTTECVDEISEAFKKEECECECECGCDCEETECDCEESKEECGCSCDPDDVPQSNGERPVAPKQEETTEEESD